MNDKSIFSVLEVWFKKQNLLVHNIMQKNPLNISNKDNEK